MKLPEARDKPKKKGTKNKVFTGEANLEIQVSWVNVRKETPLTLTPRQLDLVNYPLLLFLNLRSRNTRVTISTGESGHRDM